MVTPEELLKQGQSLIANELLDTMHEAGIIIAEIRWSTWCNHGFQLQIKTEDGKTADQDFSEEQILGFYTNENRRRLQVIEKIVSMEIRLKK